jgi:hypothetical protein
MHGGIAECWKIYSLSHTIGLNSKEGKEMKKNAGFTRSIDDLDHHNWYQVKFGDLFEVAY